MWSIHCIVQWTSYFTIAVTLFRTFDCSTVSKHVHLPLLVTDIWNWKRKILIATKSLVLENNFRFTLELSGEVALRLVNFSRGCRVDWTKVHVHNRLELILYNLCPLKLTLLRIGSSSPLKGERVSVQHKRIAISWKAK